MILRWCLPVLVADQMEEPAAVRVETRTLDRRDSLTVDLRPRGGFVARFT